MAQRVADYGAFLSKKKRIVYPRGIDAQLPSSDGLYPWQETITQWALRKGRAAIFADCGLGKTRMQLSWARAMRGPTLIFAPLCVAEQTIREGAAMEMAVQYAHDGAHDDAPVVITNYERLQRFDMSRYGAVVLDESSILKAFDGKTRGRLIEACRHVPYRLCCTATPSPNDIAELANHAEFLGLMTRPEFLATWFVHDDGGWRMKRHAVKPFFRWVASWAVALSDPGDIGYPDERFRLPPLSIIDNVVDAGVVEGALFPELGVKGIHGRLAARRGSVAQRIERAAQLADDGHQWLVWCGLNDEAERITREIPDAVNVQGSDSYETKVAAIQAFIAGRIRVLVSKPKILGFGMNFQQCRNMMFVGLSDSYEAYYQCIRRCWRFGQQHQVSAHVIVSSAERLVVENVRRKEREAKALSAQLLTQVNMFLRDEVTV